MLRVVLPTATFVALIGLWWLATVVFDWPSYLVPTPLEVVERDRRPVELPDEQLLDDARRGALGFALAIAIAVPFAVAITYSRVLELTIYPALVALNAVPKIAIAPLLVIWMGFGLGPKVVMVILISLLPDRHQHDDRAQVDAGRGRRALALAASSPLQEFVRFRFPWSLPYLFVGLKVAITLAVIGAVVGEFVGATKGLGYVIVASGQNANTTLAFAAIVLLSVMSVLLFYAIALVQRLVVPWSLEPPR